MKEKIKKFDKSYLTLVAVWLAAIAGTTPTWTTILAGCAIAGYLTWKVTSNA